MVMKPFLGVCYSDECKKADLDYHMSGEREFVKPRKVWRIDRPGVEALIVKMECAVCHKDQDFVMTPANALKAGLKSV